MSKINSCTQTYTYIKLCRAYELQTTACEIIGTMVQWKCTIGMAPKISGGSNDTPNTGFVN